MARTYVRLLTAIWSDADWRRLSRDAQWTYMLLLSQPKIDNCGLLPLVPKRWARLVDGVTEDDLRRWMSELENAGFIAIDYETDEVCIRTFVKHDKVADQPKLAINAARQFDEIESLPIRQLLARQYPGLFALKPYEPAESEDIPEPFPIPNGKPYEEDIPDPSGKLARRARAHPGDSPIPIHIPNQPPNPRPEPNVNGDGEGRDRSGDREKLTALIASAAGRSVA